MPRFVVTEIWMKQHIVEAESEDRAYADYEPFSHESDGRTLCNWHVIEVLDPQAAMAKPANPAKFRSQGQTGVTSGDSADKDDREGVAALRRSRQSDRWDR